MKESLHRSLLIPLESELQDRLTWFIGLRWIAATAILMGTWTASHYSRAGFPDDLLYLVGLAVLFYNLIFYLVARRFDWETGRLRRFIYCQIGLDWLALSLIVEFTGGVHSPAALAFTLHLIIAAILLSKAACYLLALGASFLLGAINFLQPWTPGAAPIVPSSEIALAPFSGWTLWWILTIFFIVTAYLATSITAQLRSKERAAAQSEQALEQAYKEMEALYQLGQIVNSTLDLKEVLALIAENAAKLLDKRSCFIRLFDQTGKKLYIGGSYGLSQAYIDKGPVEVEKSLIDSEALAGGVVQVVEVAEDPRFQYPEEARKEGLRSMLCVPLLAKGRVLGVIRVYSGQPHHFTEREQNLLKNLANLGAVAIRNARSYQELQDLNRQRVWFARMTHHQLRNPLAAVRGLIDALPYAGELSPKQQDLLDRSRRKLETAFEMIRDLLDLAAAQDQQEGGKIVSLWEALEGTIETARERAQAKEISFAAIKPEEDAYVRATASDLDRIVSNLLDNAVKYTPSQGEVTLEIRSGPKQITLSVQDTGPGIPDEERDDIFQSFFRGAVATKSPEVGTGLGLSIVKNLLERWNGSIELESEEGRGSCFTIHLPKQKAPDSTTHGAEARELNSRPAQ